MKTDFSKDDFNSKISKVAFKSEKFLALATHHFKGPLTYSAQIAKSLHEKWEVLDEKSKREYMAILSESLQELRTTVDSILKWAKSELHFKKSEASTIHVEALLENQIQSWKTTALWKKITIELRCNYKKSLTVDVQCLEVILQNFLSNAVKFSKEEHKIVVFCEILNEENAILIGVEDEAGGINPDQLKTIFSGNNHLPDIGTANEKGSGLGLLLSQELAESQNWELMVESSSIGSRFFIRIPHENSRG